MTVVIVDHYKITTFKIKYSIFRGMYKNIHAQLTLWDYYNIV